jgi:probable rRNA maturation factor
MKADLHLSLQQPDGRHRGCLPRHRVARWIGLALDSRPAEITVRVVDVPEGRRLNREFRGQDHATNVLTFDYAREPVVVADIVLCAEVVAREAEALGVRLEDHYAHLLVHGTLHALGHDHLRAAQARVMESTETRLLASLGIADPYRARAGQLAPAPPQGRRELPR